MKYRHVGRQVYSTAFATFVLIGSAATLKAQKGLQEPSLKKLTAQAAKALKKNRSITFTLNAKPVTPGYGLAAITSGEGTILLPDQVVFQGMLQNTSALTTPFILASCGTEQYVEMGDGKFMKLEEAPNIGRVMFSSDTSFVFGVLTELEQGSNPKSVMLNKINVWHITGVAPAALLAKLPSRKNPAGVVKVQIWIEKKEYHIVQLILTGPLLNTDTPQTSRTLRFSRFDQSTSLKVPRGQMPCSSKSKT